MPRSDALHRVRRWLVSAFQPSSTAVVARWRLRAPAPARLGAALPGVRKVFSGHQNHRPSAAAIDGVMNDRTISVSTSSPKPMVVPNWPTTRRLLTIIDAMVKANTKPAAVTTLPVAPMPRMIPVFRPAWISSLSRDTTSRL